MKILPNTLWVITALVLISFSCEKEEPMPCDSEFIPYFSCKVDGEEWVAKMPFSVGGPVAMETFFNEDIGSFYIDAKKEDKDKNTFQSIIIYGKNVLELVTEEMIVLDGDGDEHVGYYDFNANSICEAFYHDSLNPGIFEIIRFDKEKREIEGIFNMRLINRNCTDSLIHIADGQFAFRY